MALEKEIELENGIILNYHRITSLNKITNELNNIEINSYINENQRNKEKEYQNLQKENMQLQEDLNKENLSEENREKLLEKNNKMNEELEKGINVLIESEFIQIPYDEDMTIEDAYDFLKTLEKYKNSKNI